MFGKNPKRPFEKTDGNFLKIQNIFFTLQGEGLYAGEVSVFIRLGGCNLACSFCDTEFEDFKEYKLEEILNEVNQKNINKAAKLIVITGGEPFRQNIKILCNKLIEEGYKVQIETNGTLYHEINEKVDIICSPKIVNGVYHKIHPEIEKRVSAYKFLFSENIKGYDKVPDWNFENKIVFVQPIDEYNIDINNKNLRDATNYVLENGYRLSIQLHKILGIE